MKKEYQKIKDIDVEISEAKTELLIIDYWIAPKSHKEYRKEKLNHLLNELQERRIIALNALKIAVDNETYETSKKIKT